MDLLKVGGMTCVLFLYTQKRLSAGRVTGHFIVIIHCPSAPLLLLSFSWHDWASTHAPRAQYTLKSMLLGPLRQTASPKAATTQWLLHPNGLRYNWPKVFSSRLCLMDLFAKDLEMHINNWHNWWSFVIGDFAFEGVRTRSLHGLSGPGLSW